MRRLNIEAEYVDASVEKSVYGLKSQREEFNASRHTFELTTPRLQPDELLLLQEVGRRRGLRRGYQTNFALVFDHIAHDSLYDDNTTVINHLWPNANPNWRLILYGSATIPTIPFSLNDLDLSKHYDNFTPYPIIKKEDEEKIERYILGALAEIPDLTHQYVPVSYIVRAFGKQATLSALHNHDHIVRLRAKSKGTANREKCEPNPYLAKILASYYEYRCQICGKDCSLNLYSDVYGEVFSETHYIQDLTQGGLDISENIVVLCPDHHRIIQATNALFHYQSLAFEYPSGLSEPLILRDHFENAKRLATLPDAAS